MRPPDSRKSGQAIIFLMVVLIVGILAVVWVYDLHRVVNAKLRMRSAGDAAAMAAARWQGHTLNMIGDLNLIQAALLSEAYAEFLNQTNYPTFDEFLPYSQQYAEIEPLPELRERLEYIGPLAGFAAAQQAALNNGALPDPLLASNLTAMAQSMRDEIGSEPYAEARDDYADLLDDLAARGPVVSSYRLDLPDHPLAKRAFYEAIAMAQADWWCPMRDYQYELENYENFESWSTLDTEFDYELLFDLKLDTFSFSSSGSYPSTSSFTNADDYIEALGDYLEYHEVIEADGEPDYVLAGMYLEEEFDWHIYDSDWNEQWPSPAEYDDETTIDELDPLAIRTQVKAEYDYLGAVAGIAMASAVPRGILASTANPDVNLSYRAKAKVFGVMQGDDVEPPYYYGLVFPCFTDVRLVHSDIGDRVIDPVFYEHLMHHLEAYLENGPEALDPGCPYCRLLLAWDELDHQAGAAWLDEAYSDDEDNPCEPESEGYSPVWGDDGGGASGAQ